MSALVAKWANGLDSWRFQKCSLLNVARFGLSTFLVVVPIYPILWYFFGESQTHFIIFIGQWPFRFGLEKLVCPISDQSQKAPWLYILNWKSTVFVFGGQHEVLRLFSDSPALVTPTLNFEAVPGRFIFRIFPPIGYFSYFALFLGCSVGNRAAVPVLNWNFQDSCGLSS